MQTAIESAESIVTELLDGAGITVNGDQPFDIRIVDQRFFQRVLGQGALGLGETYMEGWWECAALDRFFDRVVRAELEKKVRKDWRTIRQVLNSKLFNLQRASRAYQVGEQHYDLGNDLYEAMLDRRLNYTCGYWRKARDLDQAQEAKLELVCQKIGLRPGMKVLELGCGFGAFARYAAEKHGVEVTGVTVSREQVDLGRKRCQGLPVKLVLDDYRNVTGEFDRVISIGIMEHVGYKNYPTYMNVVNRTLKKDGIAFIHTIGGNTTKTSANPWVDKYIFPNGMLPSIAQLGSAMEEHFVMEDWHNLGPDYDRTLMAWHQNFETAWPTLSANYDERFHRMWRYYLLSSAGGFRSRGLQLWQIVMTRTGTAQPDCRIT
jgi:cyclopropane-fatty-acyl-phospholipid synthase